jgi:hypothetical protein
MGKGKKKGDVKPVEGKAGGAEASGDAVACAECGLRSAELKTCARCLQVAYCSKE